MATATTPTATTGKKKKRLMALASSGGRPGNRTASSSMEGCGGYKRDCELLDLSKYTNVTVVTSEDASGGVPIILAIAQAMVTMEDLVEATLRHSHSHPAVPLPLPCVPRVVAEFRHITVGGAISGASLESTSHRYGQFADTVVWIRARLGDGRIVKTYRGEPLWCDLSGTYGSVATILEAAIECVPVPSSCCHVKVSYHDFPSIDEGVPALVRMCSSSNQNEHKAQDDDDDCCFLEGLQFPNEYGGRLAGTVVAMRGRMINDDSSVPPVLGWKAPSSGGGPFYFEHVVDVLSDGLKRRRIDSPEHVGTTKSNNNDPFFEEGIEIRDFLFRYDDGAFWMARPMAFSWRHLASYFPFTIGMFAASYRWVRKYLGTGRLFTTRRLFGLLHLAPPAVVAQNVIVQDLYMPATTAIADLVHWVRRTLPLSTPLWLCPVRTNSDQPFTPSYSSSSSPHSSSEEQKDGISVSSSIMINCGVYGRVPDGRGREYTQRLEERCFGLGGRKMLYAQTYYSRGRFWSIYDEQRYEQQRQQHGAVDAFPDLYAKTCTPVPERNPNSWKEWIAAWLL